MFQRFFRALAGITALTLAFSPVMSSAQMSGTSFNASEFLQKLEARLESSPKKYIVVFKKDESTNDVESKYNVKRARVFEKVLNGFSAQLSDEQLTKLRKDARVEFIEPDYVVTAFKVPKANFDWSRLFPNKNSSSSKPSSVSSSSMSSSSSVSSSSSKVSSVSSVSSSVSSSSKPSSSSSSSSSVAISVPTGLNRIDAEKSPTAKIDGVANALDVDVAIIDTGIDLTHTDLNVFKNVNLIMPTKNGNDDNGHGSHVAGIIGAKDDGKGVVGVAPGARLWAVKVLNANGSGLMSDIIAGIDYVTKNASQIEVANMSLGCECTSTALSNAINNAVNAGVVITVAAGNSAKDSSTFSPANNSNVITVSAIADFNGLPGGGAAATCRSDVDETFADFSNFGAPVDIAAPGVCIYSTYKGGGYSTLSGTSMASPHVAGAVALYIAGHGRATNASGVTSIKNAILSTAFPQSSANGFSGDPDSFKEPLLNVSSF